MLKPPSAAFAVLSVHLVDAVPGPWPRIPLFIGLAASDSPHVEPWRVFVVFGVFTIGDCHYCDRVSACSTTSTGAFSSLQVADLGPAPKKLTTPLRPAPRLW
jgi:hypothetical protein